MRWRLKVYLQINYGNKKMMLINKTEKRPCKDEQVVLGTSHNMVVDFLFCLCSFFIPVAKCEQTEMKMKLCCSSPHSPRTPDSAWSWLVCFSACFSFVLVFGMPYCYAVVMPIFLDYFKESREKIAWAGSVAKPLIFFCTPLSTMVMTRLNIRNTAILGILMCITSLVVTSFTTSIIQLFFSYSILYGSGLSLLYSSCIFATTKYFNKRRAVAIGIVIGGPYIGVLSLGPIVQLLIDWYGFRTMYRIMAGSFVLPLLAVCTFDPNVEDPTAEHNEDQQDKWKWSMVPEIFKRPMYVVAVIVILQQVIGGFVSFVHLVNYCLEVGIPAQKASNLFIAIGLCSLVTSIIAGRLIDHNGVNPFHVNQAAALCMALSTLLLQLSSSYILFIFFSIFLGFGIGFFNTSYIVLFLQTVEPRLRQYSFAMGVMVGGIGDLTGPPLVGFIADRTGSYKPGFYTAGAILLLSFFLPFLQYYFKPWRIPEMERQKTEIEISKSPESQNVQENRQNVHNKETVALEMVNKKRTAEDTKMTSYLNQAIEGKSCCGKAADIESGHDNKGLKPETAMDGDCFETKF